MLFFLLKAEKMHCINFIRAKLFVLMPRKKTPYLFIANDKSIEVKYVGFEIDHEFVLGYGLDYDGLGRNLKDIYKQVTADSAH